MKTFSLLVAGCLLGLAAAEVAIRLTGYGRGFFERDSVIGYRLAPSASRAMSQATTNNLGLRRDGDTSVEKPAGTRRVLVLGDSQTEGVVANAETYAALLERMLEGDDRLGRVEVLNAGVSGYSPLLEYLWLREQGARLQPDIVVLALSTGDDIGELTADEVDVAGDGPRLPIATLAREGAAWVVVPPGGPEALPATDAWLQVQMQTYALLRSHVGNGSPEGIEALGQAARECGGCLQALGQQWLAQDRPVAFDEGVLELREVLRRYRTLAAEIGARPVVILVPTKLEVEEDTVRGDVAAAKTALGLQTEPMVFADTVRAQILAACAAQKLEVIDLLPALRQARARGGQPLYGSDWHLNREGNRAVAEALKARLTELVATR